MSRPRTSRSDEKLPSYVYRDNAGYFYRPYVKGQPRRKHRILSDPHATVGEVWIAFQNWQERDKTDTVVWLLDKYMDSHEFTHLKGKPKSDRTIREQRNYYRTLINKAVGNDSFGQWNLNDITPGGIKNYLDKRKQEDAAILGNLEIAFFSKAWSWAYQRDITRLTNPCLGVERNHSEPDDYYVPDDEYEDFIGLAKAHGPEYVWIAMELSYLCRMRKIEVLKTLRSSVLENGLDTQRVKGSLDAITAWTPRLKAAVDAALALNDGQVESIYLLVNTKGQPIADSGFNSVWQRLRQRASKQGIKPLKFHWLKAKGVSDFDGDKQAASGHKTSAMVSRYDRKKKVVKATR